MINFKEQDFAINLKLIKRYGFVQIFNPNSRKILNWNIYHISLITIVVIIQCIDIFGIIGFFYETKGTITEIDIIIYLHVLIQNYLCLWKFVMFLYKSNTVWDVLFNVTRMNFLTSKRCWEFSKLLHESRKWITKITKIYFIFACFITIQWDLCPLVVNMFTTYDNENPRFLQNIFNIRFPINMYTYNQYYVIFYVMELSIVSFLSALISITDIFILSLSLIIITQFKVLSRAFENIGYQQEHQITGKNF